MGELLLNIAIMSLAVLGGLYALGLILVALIGPPTTDDLLDEDTLYCECGCKNKAPMDICSSECDDECAANEHYPGEDWRR